MILITGVLAMIRMAAESAHAEGKWIGVIAENSEQM